MKDHRLQPVSPSLGHWSFLLQVICCSLLLIGLAPGVASAGGEKVTLCHVPPGDPAAAHEIVVAPSAVKAHLKNHAGDHLGPCALPPECQTNDQCNDANPCTVDTCTPTGTCDHSQPVSCNDGNPCTNDVCIAEQGGCVGVPAPGVTCDDGDVCTEPDTCNATGACQGTAITGCCLSDAACEDTDACTTDVCNLTTHTCSNPAVECPTPPPCEVAICNSATGCGTAPVTCPDDGNICTIEVCDPTIGETGACVTQPNPTPPETPSEVTCNDGLDNDCDGLVDTADSDCAGGEGTCTPTPGSCNDGVDNDCDNVVDAADPGCAVQCAANPCDPNPCEAFSACDPLPEGFEEFRETGGCYVCMGL